MPKQYCRGRKTVASILALWGSGSNAAPPEIKIKNVKYIYFHIKGTEFLPQNQLF